MFSPNPETLRKWADAGLSLLYPDVCQLCREQPATRRDGYVCGQCWQDVRFIKPPFCERCGLPFQGEITTSFECTNCRQMELHFCWARSSVIARGAVLEAIHRYKYTRHLWFEEFLADLFVRGARDSFAEASWDAIVPVPLFPVKQREREFNQAERLARRLGQAVALPVQSDLLKRVVATPSQTRLSRRERADNMRHAFAMRTDQPVKGRRFVLVDDVFTTGATTSACAKVLLQAGAEAVAVWTVARGV